MSDENGPSAREFALLNADFGWTHREAEQPLNAWIFNLEGEQ